MILRWALVGCLVPILLLGAMFQGLLLWFDFSAPHGRLPAAIATTGVTVSQDYFGCLYAAYNLHPDTVVTIKRGGLEMLNKLAHPAAEDPDNRYGPWQETPVRDLFNARPGDWPVKEPFALGAANGCEALRPTAVDVYPSLVKAGSYFALTENEEGMMVLDPARGIAIVLSFG